MRLMRSHNLAYFRWFLEYKKSRLHIAVQTGFHAYSGNIKCVLCDRIKWYQNTLSLCSSRSQSSSSLIAVASSIAVGSRPSVRSGVQRSVCSSLWFSKRSTMPFSVSVATQPSCISLDGWSKNLSLLIGLLIAVKLLGFVNAIFKLCNIALLVKNNIAISFVHFVTEVVATTFIAVVAGANLVVFLCVLCAIGFSFFQCGELCYLIHLYVVVIIYAIFLHNLL